MSGVTDCIKCAFLGHEMVWDCAVDRVEDGASRVYGDGTTEPVDACTLVDECRRCGKEKRIGAAVPTARNLGYRLTWEGGDTND